MTQIAERANPQDGSSFNPLRCLAPPQRSPRASCALSPPKTPPAGAAPRRRRRHVHAAANMWPRFRRLPDARGVPTRRRPQNRLALDVKSRRTRRKALFQPQHGEKAHTYTEPVKNKPGRSGGLWKEQGTSGGWCSRGSAGGGSAGFSGTGRSYLRGKRRKSENCRVLTCDQDGICVQKRQLTCAGLTVIRQPGALSSREAQKKRGKFEFLISVWSQQQQVDFCNSRLVISYKN